MLRFKYFSNNDWKDIESWLKKRVEYGYEVEDTVKEIIKKVNQEGDDALLDYTRRYDCPNFFVSDIRVDPEKIRKSLDEVESSDLDLLKETIQRIFNFHEKQKENSWLTTEEGVISGQIVRPMDRVGLYVPGGQGGKTPLISSLIMSAIPAKVAGVEEIVVVTPPREDGSVHPYILATAYILEIEHVFAIGSAWAIAALTFGTDTVPKVDMIVGPGNIYVTIAKKLLSGSVGIDMFAGPSEVVILADKSAEPKWIAADLLSQAEHDELASSILISSDLELINKVERVLATKVEELPRKRVANNSLKNWGAFIHVSDLEKGFELINLLAPEHLEICIQNPWVALDKVKSTGTIFLGHYTPEPIGDYFAGPNHILPTSGSARFSSGLGVKDFYKRINFLSTSLSFAQKHGPKVARLARIEGLEAHARSIEERY